MTLAARLSITDAQRRVDPTQTGAIRARFVADMRKRFRAIKDVIWEAIVEQDVLGAGIAPSGKQKLTALEFLKTWGRNVIGDQAPGPNAFAFSRSADRIAAFMEWLRMENAMNILQVSVGTPVRNAAAASWMNVYIDTAYRKGVRDAGAKMKVGGARISSGWVGNALNRPIHADRVGLIYTRVFSELKGITEAMEQKISRVLAQGMAEGMNPRLIANNLVSEVDKITNTRAEVLARTEVISAHAEASLNAYEEAGIEGVEVEAEWSTAGDDRVCPECEDYEGKTFAMNEARNLIPLHPNCRCAWIPLVVNGTGITLE